MSARYDVVVVGAGMAGLCAARALAKAGKQVLVLEAGERAGGRVWTVPSSGGTMACELGAEFVHGKPEPTLRLAREAGVELLPLSDHHMSKEGTVFRELQSPWQEFAAVLERVRPQDEDTSARTFLERNVDDPQLRERIRQLVEGFEAAPLSEVGIQSLTTDAQSLSREHSQFRLAGGYGKVVDFCLQELVEAKVELRLRSRVTRVKWQVHGPVELSVAGRADVIGGRACVVTVPLPILQDSESLRFEPGVPALHAPLARLGMGHAARVMLQFPKDFAARAAPRNVFIHQPSALYEAYWAQENHGFVQWTAWAGGPKAEELARESSEQRKHLALAGLGTLLGLPEATLEADLVCPIRHHDFSNDARLRGAYSFCRPGGADAARALSAPVGGALFLAGEATDHDYPGTVAGAIASGARAAEQALSVLAG